MTNTLAILLEISTTINYSWTKLSVRIIGAIKRQFFHMVTHVFDNSNLSQENFCKRHLGSCNMLFGTSSQAHAYDPSDYMETRLKLKLQDAIYRLRFYSNSLTHILSLSNSHNNIPSIQKNRGDKSHRVIVALSYRTNDEKLSI